MITKGNSDFDFFPLKFYDLYVYRHHIQQQRSSLYVYAVIYVCVSESDTKFVVLNAGTGFYAGW